MECCGPVTCVAESSRAILKQVERELIEKVRWLYTEATNFDTGVPAVIELSDPDVEIWPTGTFPGIALTYRGHEGIREFFGQLWDAFDALHFALENVTVVGDAFVAEVRMVAQGSGSGIEIEQRFTHVLRFRDGRLYRLEAYTGVEEALAAATAEP